MRLDNVELLGAEEQDNITTLKQVLERDVSMFSVLDCLEELGYPTIGSDIIGNIYLSSKTYNQMIKELELYEKALDAVPEDYQ